MFVWPADESKSPHAKATFLLYVNNLCIFMLLHGCIRGMGIGIGMVA